jgi:DNA-binding NtrC family response regulator
MDLERIAVRMHRTGILCSEGLKEFKKQFIITALKTAKGNRTLAAEVLGMHVNTLGRNIRALDIDVSALVRS